MQRTFDIVEPARNPRVLLLLFTLVPTTIVIGLLYAFMRPAPPMAVPALLLVVIIVQNLVIGRWIERCRVALDGTMLEIQAGMGKQRIAVADIDLGDARVLRLDEHPEWKPFVKTGGLGMPGLSLGWFRTRNLSRIYCLLTDRERVVVLPLRARKEALLLSVKRPDELLSALHAADDAARQRR